MPGKIDPDAFYHKQIRAFKRQLFLNAVSEVGTNVWMLAGALEVDRTAVMAIRRRYAPEVVLTGKNDRILGRKRYRTRVRGMH